MKRYYVYIMCSPSGTLYTGVTSNLRRRVDEHKRKAVPGFTSKYNVTRLVHFEWTDDPGAALAREKEIKGWRRAKKLELIESRNPQWADLSAGWHKED
jgi:putative endonuclease